MYPSCPIFAGIIGKVHRRTNMILRSFVSQNAHLLIRAYITYVRPLLEYNCVVWSPHLKCNIELIEQVQCRFTKWLHGLSNYTYDERLKMLNLENLQPRHTCFDLIMCYKIISGLVCVNADDFFEFCVINTRGHSYKLNQQFSNCTSQSKFLSEHIVSLWESLK